MPEEQFSDIDAELAALEAEEAQLAGGSESGVATPADIDSELAALEAEEARLSGALFGEPQSVQTPNPFAVFGNPVEERKAKEEEERLLAEKAEAERVKTPVEELVTDVKEVGGGLLEEVTDVAGNVIQKGKELAGEAVDFASDTANELIEKGREQIPGLVENFNRSKDQAGKELSENFQRFKGNLGRGYEKVKNFTTETVASAIRGSLEEDAAELAHPVMTAINSKAIEESQKTFDDYAVALKARLDAGEGEAFKRLQAKGEQGFKETLETLWNDKEIVTGILVEQWPNLLEEMSAQIGGAVAGGALGGISSLGIGTGVGAVAGGATAQWPITYNNTRLAYFQGQVKTYLAENRLEINGENIKRFAASREGRTAIIKADKYAFTIATAASGSAIVGGGAVTSMTAKLAGRAGVEVGFKGGRVVLKSGADFALATTTELSGEALGQLVTDGKINPQELAIEAAASAPGVLVDVSVGSAARTKKVLDNSKGLLSNDRKKGVEKDGSEDTRDVDAEQESADGEEKASESNKEGVVEGQDEGTTDGESGESGETPGTNQGGERSEEGTGATDDGLADDVRGLERIEEINQLVDDLRLAQEDLASGFLDEETTKATEELIQTVTERIQDLTKEALDVRGNTEETTSGSQGESGEVSSASEDGGSGSGEEASGLEGQETGEVRAEERDSGGKDSEVQSGEGESLGEAKGVEASAELVEADFIPKAKRKTREQQLLEQEERELAVPLELRSEINSTDSQPATTGGLTTSPDTEVLLKDADRRIVPIPALVSLVNNIGSRATIRTELKNVLGFVSKDRKTKAGSSVKLKKEIATNPERYAETFAHEIGHVLDVVAGKEIKGLNAKLAPFIKVHLFTNNFLKNAFSKDKAGTLKAEGYALSKIWRPFDEAKADAKFKKYRESNSEIFADFVSALINNPELVKQEAPNLYNAWDFLLKSSPEVAKNLADMNRFISNPETGVKIVEAGLAEDSKQTRKIIKKKKAESEQLVNENSSLRQFFNGVRGDFFNKDFKTWDGLALAVKKRVIDKEAQAWLLNRIQKRDRVDSVIDIKLGFKQLNEITFKLKELTTDLVKNRSQEDVDADANKFFIANRVLNETTAGREWIKQSPGDAVDAYDWILKTLSKIDEDLETDFFSKAVNRENEVGKAIEAFKANKIDPEQLADELAKVDFNISLLSKNGQKRVIKKLIDKADKINTGDPDITSEDAVRAINNIKEGFNIRRFLANPRGITKVEAESILGNLREKYGTDYQTFIDVSESMGEINKSVLDLLADKNTGIISKEARDRFALNSSNYVAFDVLKYFEENGNFTVGIREQSGTHEAVTDTLISTMEKMKGLIYQAYSQDAKNATVEAALLEQSATGEKLVEVLATETGKKGEEGFNIVSKYQRLMEERNKLASKPGDKNYNASYFIKMENGKRILYKINDRSYGNAFDKAEIKPGTARIIRVSNAFNNVFRKMWINYSIPFVTSSFTRDASKEATAAKPFLGLVPNLHLFGVHLNPRLLWMRTKNLFISNAEVRRAFKDPANWEPKNQKMKFLLENHSISDPRSNLNLLVGTEKLSEVALDGEKLKQFTSAQDMLAHTTGMKIVPTLVGLVDAIPNPFGVTTIPKKTLKFGISASAAAIDYATLGTVRKTANWLNKNWHSFLIAQELAAKLGGFDIAKSDGVSDIEAANFARIAFGTPDERGGGRRKTELNAAYMFGSVSNNSYRALTTLASNNPKRVLYNFGSQQLFLHSMLLAGVAGGVMKALGFDDEEAEKWEATIKKIPEYAKISERPLIVGFVGSEGEFVYYGSDKATNEFINSPSTKVFYLKQPIDYDLQHISRATWLFLKQFNELNNSDGLSGLLSDFFSTSVEPLLLDLSPAADTFVGGPAQILTRGNYYDSFRGRDLFNQSESKQLNKMEKLTKFLEFQLSKTRLIPYKKPFELEKEAGIAGLSNTPLWKMSALGAMFRVTNMGSREVEEQVQKKFEDILPESVKELKREQRILKKRFKFNPEKRTKEDARRLSYLNSFFNKHQGVFINHKRELLESIEGNDSERIDALLESFKKATETDAANWSSLTKGKNKGTARSRKQYERMISSAKKALQGN